MGHRILLKVALLATALFSASIASPAQSARPVRTPAGGKAARAYGQLPLTFEANRGQTDAQVNFLSRGDGYAIFLTSKGMVLSLQAPVGTSATKPEATKAVGTATIPAASGPKAAATPAVKTVSFNLVGAAAEPTAVGEKQQPGIANYFIGSDHSKWLTRIPTYGQIRYKAVYPGIDLVYYGKDRQVEYDFAVGPHADASQIKFQVSGADALSISDAGDLDLKVGTEKLEFKAPAIYQEVNGQRAQVAGSYRVAGNQIVFDVAAHDPSKALVIDPVLVYSTYVGGRASDSATAVALDSIGNAYIVGNTTSPDFPLSSGFGVAGGNGDPIYVAKIDVSGANVLYADYIAGSSSDNPVGIAVAPNGTAYITGNTSSTNFPTKGPYQATNKSAVNYGRSVFISELSPDGATLNYSTYLGGSTDQNVSGIVVSSAGEMIVAGGTSSADFPLSTTPYQSSFPATLSNDYTPYIAYVTRLTADGSALVYSTFYSGTALSGQSSCGGEFFCNLYDPADGIGIDTNGNAYIAGSTNGIDQPTTGSAYQGSYPANSSSFTEVAYLAKFSPSGALSYATYFGPNDPSGDYSYLELYSLAVDPSGEAYLFGNSDDTANLPMVAGGICTTSESCSSYFLTKFSSDGTTVVLSTLLPSISNEEYNRVATDSSGNIFLLGSAYGNVDSSLTDRIEAYVASQDVLLTELNPSATAETFSTVLGGEEGDSPSGFAIDSTGAVYIVGDTSSSDFPVTEASYQQTNGGSRNVFLSKIDMSTNAPAVAIAPSLLQYSVRDVGTAAQQKQVILRNMGTEPLLISKLTTSGDFSQINTCGSSVAAGGTCNFTVTFSPTAPGSRFGTILIEDNAVGSPHFINLSGVGATPVVALNPTSLTFSSLQVNASSAVQTVTLTNNGNATLNIASIVASGDFAQTNDCPASVALGAGCTVSLTFTPTAGGTRTGSLTITDNAPDSPETVSLTGSGYVTTATLSASSLQFGSVAANATSAARTVTVTNTGANPMVVTAVNVTGNFAQTNNCSTIAHAASCTLSVTFKPLISGAVTGTVTLSDNAQGNPHQITLTGTGIAPGVSISPPSLTFGTQNAGTSAIKTLTITNSGNATLTFSSIQVLGDFAQTNNCSSVAASATCTVTVSFDPTANGTLAGSIIFTDGAGNSPQTVALTGTGVAGLLTVSPSTLSFASQPIGSASASQTITMKNVGSAAMPISSVVALGSFTETNNCPVSLAEGASCTVNVSFAPLTSGAASGAISLNGSTSTIPVSIAGMGSDFSLTPLAATSSQNPGSSATYTLNVASVGGAFSNAISLTCTGAPVGSTCSFSKQSVTPGSSTVPVTVTITTVSSSILARPLTHGGSGTLALWILPANGFGLALLVFALPRRKQYRRMFLTLLLPFLIGTTLIVGCGGKSAVGGGTPAGTYQVTVVGTSGSLQHFTTLTMKVE